MSCKPLHHGIVLYACAHTQGTPDTGYVCKYIDYFLANDIKLLMFFVQCNLLNLVLFE